MKLEQLVRAFAGFMVLLSLLLAYVFTMKWLILTAFVGLNLLQSAFTKFCPAEIMFKKLGLAKD